MTNRPMWLLRFAGARAFPMWLPTRLRAWPMTPVDMLMACGGANDKRSRDVWLVTEYAPNSDVIERAAGEGWACTVLEDHEEATA